MSNTNILKRLLPSLHLGKPWYGVASTATDEPGGKTVSTEKKYPAADIKYSTMIHRLKPGYFQEVKVKTANTKIFR